jgi:hypothetical protein
LAIGLALQRSAFSAEPAHAGHTSEPALDIDLGEAAGAPIDLLQRCPTALTEGDSNPEQARVCEFNQTDLYTLTGFSFRLGTRLHLDVGEADLGIGHCPDGAAVGHCDSSD